jgi:hypothetical protein
MIFLSLLPFLCHPLPHSGGGGRGPINYFLGSSGDDQLAKIHQDVEKEKKNCNRHTIVCSLGEVKKLLVIS